MTNDENIDLLALLAWEAFVTSSRRAQPVVTHTSEASMAILGTPLMRSTIETAHQLLWSVVSGARRACRFVSCLTHKRFSDFTAEKTPSGNVVNTLPPRFLYRHQRRKHGWRRGGVTRTGDDGKVSRNS